MGPHEARAKLQAAKALPASLGKPLFYPLPCPHSNEILAVFFLFNHFACEKDQSWYKARRKLMRS